MFIKSFPDEMDLLGFFESEPVISDVEDLHFVYKTNDDNGVEILFSFCATAGWIKTIISCNGKEISKYLSEDINEITLKKDNLGEYLYSEIITDELITKFEIRVRPYISVNSNSLVR
ncbi:hypothetical protein IRM71_14595 [Erwinia amylovora]|uniref:hypothetical protein n=1 Tax=Erwinia amylovora TaxID=552 RepID=UPI000C08B4F6|nr:hypothetical protein [Erwinia amylovora]UDJ87391.1 hypothetical protein IRM68_03225 [Erwinia amylovora]UDJ98850.1 hypothetical protein IRM69_16855 [Erwinia amylovora]UDK89093.1 hypothetical protein IRM70_14610 [Erwinia amylovora]UDK92486.1 hypothetical protein IRM71_14595 [Erwinia amylovora]UOD73310.1 hypothetical protein IRM67_09710 [Erwinia amylovora]